MAKSIILSLCFITAFLLIQGANSAELTFNNTCPYPVYPGILSHAGVTRLPMTGFKLATGASIVLTAPPKGSGVSFVLTVPPKWPGVSFVLTVPPKQTGASFVLTAPPKRSGVSFVLMAPPKRTGASFVLTAPPKRSGASFVLMAPPKRTGASFVLTAPPKRTGWMGASFVLMAPLKWTGARLILSAPRKRTGANIVLTAPPKRTGASFVLTAPPKRTGTSFVLTAPPERTDVSFVLTASPKWSDASIVLTAPPKWTGRMWANTPCTTDSARRFSCAFADCGSGQLEYNMGLIPPATLVEITLNGTNNEDFYDISNVDSFNLPISIVPSSSTYSPTTCTVSLLARCPQELWSRALDGTVIGWNSACLAFNTDQHCCRGAFGTSTQVCKPSSCSLYFKKACPQAYSCAYDDGTCTFRLTDAGVTPFLMTGFKFEPDASFVVTAPPTWSGRMRAGTLWTTHSTGWSSCAFADCGSHVLECNNMGAIPPATLVEFTLNGANNKDFYDISNVDGFNLPISIVPSSSTCSSGTTCTVNLLVGCPQEIWSQAPNGTVIGCKSARLVFNTMAPVALLFPFSLPFLFKMIILSHFLLVFMVGVCLLLSVVPLDHDPDLLDPNIETGLGSDSESGPGSDSGSDMDDMPSLETLSDESFNSETGLNKHNQRTNTYQPNSDSESDEDEREIRYINGRLIRLNSPIFPSPQQDPCMLFEREILCTITEEDEEETEIAERPRVGFKRRFIRKCRSILRCSCFI